MAQEALTAGATGPGSMATGFPWMISPAMAMNGFLGILGGGIFAGSRITMYFRVHEPANSMMTTMAAAIMLILRML